MDFSAETQALIDEAESRRDAAVEARTQSRSDADAAASAATTAKSSADAFTAATKDAAAAKAAALGAIDRELSIPADQPPQPAAAPSPLIGAAARAARR